MMADVDYCVVGAGFAGLTAALRLKQAGRSVALLEARDRVGGPTYTEVLTDGSWIDRGGAWIGPGQDRVYASMNEFGVPAYKQYIDGESMMIVDGKQRRYAGAIPWTVSPWATMNLGIGLIKVRQMCRSIPLQAPLQARKAAEWDRISLAAWLDKNILSQRARGMLDMALAGSYTSAASEVSLLWISTRWRRGADRTSSCRAKTAPRIPARWAGWEPSIGRWPPNSAMHCSYRSRCGISPRTSTASGSAPTS
jgi:monoamine oxidase